MCVHWLAGRGGMGWGGGGGCFVFLHICTPPTVVADALKHVGPPNPKS